MLLTIAGLAADIANMAKKKATRRWLFYNTIELSSCRAVSGSDVTVQLLQLIALQLLRS
jgi:hypothetical protein